MKNSRKWIIAAFAVLIALIIGLTISLIVVLNRNNEKPAKDRVKDTKVEENHAGEPTPTEPSLTPSAEPTGVEPTKEPTKEPTNEPTPTEEITPMPTVTPEKGTPLENHGKLMVKGTKLCDASGEPYQLKGISTHGLQWFPQYVNPETFRCLRDEFGANVVRLAMYTDENGYCVGGEAVQKKLKECVNNGVKYATDLGMYVIIDWHILHDLTPMKYVEQAKPFFEEMSKKYAGYDNVIYEICNEPNGGTGWAEIKKYAEIIIPIIRANDPKAIIIVGTPTWSQDVDQAAKDPIKSDNVMYALHFYAGTHKDSLRQKMVSAIKAGLPVFVSEFGITDASGNGRCDIEEANKWVLVMDNYQVSYICWNLANKDETSSLIKKHVTKLSGFKPEDLSVEGNWLIDILHGRVPEPKEETLQDILDSAQGGVDANAPKAVAYGRTSNGAEISFRSTNTWMEGGKYCYQFDVAIKNVSGQNIGSWKLKASCNTNVTSKNFWCCKFTPGTNGFTVAPESWNGTIAKNGTATGIGIIIMADAPLEIKSIELTK